MKKIFSVGLAFSVMAVLFSSAAFTANLTAYRQAEEFVTAAAAENPVILARQRVGRLRNLLQTQGFLFSVLSSQGGPFSQRAEFQRKHEIKAATYFKKVLLGAADRLQIQEQYDSPEVFDPSSFEHEIDQKIQTRRRAFFEKALGPDFESIYNQLRAQLSIKPADTSSAPLPENTAENAGMNIVVRTNLLANYIGMTQPKGGEQVSEGEAPSPPSQTIEAVLGQLYRVDVFDDVTTKLRFSKLNLPVGSLQAVASTEEVALSLSMLINVRTELDTYLVFVLGYVHEALEKKKADLITQKAAFEEHGVWTWEKTQYDSVNEQLSQLEPVLSHVHEQYEGAKWANKMLSGLSPKQLDFLIDLMLQLRGDDIPVAADAQKLAGLAEKNSDKYMDDYQFYKTTHEELYRLENYLDAERQMEAKVQGIIQRMKQEKKNK